MSKAFDPIKIIWIAASLLLGSGVLPARATQGQEGVQVSLTPKSGALSLHEPIQMLLHIHNGSAARVEMDLGRNYKGNLVFRIVPPDGVVVQNLRLDPGIGGAYVPGAISLGPGEDHRQLLLINEWYPFARAGEYTVELSLSQEIPGRDLQAQAPSAKALSAKAQINLGPRDPAHLAEICSKLATQALSYEFEVASSAANALSFAADEACVPHLGQVLLKSFHGKEGAIEGLARVGSSEAIAYMVDAWDALRWDQQALAKREFAHHDRGEALLQALATAHKKMAAPDF